MNVLSKVGRPSEITAALALLPTAYAAFLAIDFSQPLAGGLAAVVALVPWAISWWRDGQPTADDPGDHDAEGGPPTRSLKTRGESRGLEHSRRR